MARDSRKIAAILAADVVDYSRLMGADEAGTLAALALRRALFERLVREFDGRVFGSVGDSLMAEFASAVNAVECARAIQVAVADEGAGVAPDKRMRLRIGVNLGDVIEGADGVAGDAVNVAARLQALAKPGGVLVSGAVHEQVRRKVEARYVDAGTRRVKNIAEPVRTFEVLPPPVGAAGRARAGIARIASRRVVRIAAVVAAFAAVAVAGLFWREIPVPTTGRTLGAIVEPGPATPNTIAVLPFVNMTGNPANDYLGDGLADELIHRLGSIAGLRVTPRRSAFAYKDSNVDVRKIAESLEVNYIVEGSVRRQGALVRVSASLVERAAGSNRWSNTYESSGDFFAIEDDIGTQVLTALKLVLESRPGQPSAGRRNAAAYDRYLRGLSYLRGPRSDASLDAAEQQFSQALAEQPDFARAQAGLCQVRVERFALDREPAHVAAAESACSRARALDGSAHEVFEAIGQLRLATGNQPEAEAAYRQALGIAPESPDILIGLAEALAAGGQAAEAELNYRRAIAVQPRYPTAHSAFGHFLVAHGRAREAVDAYERATQLAPDNPNAFNNLGGAYLYVGDFDKADAAFSRSLAIEPRRGSYSNVGTAHYYRGRFGEAADMFRKAIDLTPADHRVWGNLADALWFGAQREEATDAYRRALHLAEGELVVNPRHAANQAQAAYYASRLREADRARQHIGIALAEGNDTDSVHYYVALAELGLGNRTQAIAHARRARELGYPESFLKAAPELREIRASI